MSFDPEEIVTLGGAPMTLRRAVAKVIEIPPSHRGLATIFRRKGPASILDIDAIEALALSPDFVPPADR